MPCTTDLQNIHIEALPWFAHRSENFLVKKPRQNEDVWLVAQLLIRQHGADAPLEARRSASKLLLDLADLEAWAFWKQAMRRAEQLLLTESSGPLH